MNPDGFSQTVRRLMDGESLDDFCEWFVATQWQQTLAMGNLPADALSDVRRSLLHVARQLWGQMPYPPNRWRARGLSKVERNDPCYCGSGRKYKHCCAKFEHEILPIDSGALLVMALENSPEALTHSEKLKEVPATALGQAAMRWNDVGQADRTIALLGPLFEDLKSLDERHETAFDALVDAMQERGQERDRRALIDRVAKHPDKALATAARCRLVSILADQGETDQAWKLFHDTSRFDPNNPQLWSLELTLLLSLGRQDEARLRAPLLAMRARQAGLPELADVLVAMAQQGIGFLRDQMLGEVNKPLEQAWIELTRDLPEQLDTATLHSFYNVMLSAQESGADEGGEPVQVAWVEPVKKMTDLNRKWQKSFGVGKPQMTGLDGEVGQLLEALPEAHAFLRKHPQAWFSAYILDDLLLLAVALCDEDAPKTVFQAAQNMARHAVAVLRSLAGGGQVHWVIQEHRPLLRGLAIAVELALRVEDDASAFEFLNLGLTLNPNDNHGWRTVLSPMLMAHGDYSAALALLDRYPQDMPPSEHHRALALFNLDRKSEAEAVLRQAHSDYPLYLKILWPEVMDAPSTEKERGYALGSEVAAWCFRQECRHLWVRTGALAWTQGLQLPELQADKTQKFAKGPNKKTTKSVAGQKVTDKPNSSTMSSKLLVQGYTPKQEKHLQKICSDYPRLHGFLQGVAWSPQVLMPNAWLQAVMEMHDRMPKSRTEATATKAMHEALGATMNLYNHLNQQVLDHLGDVQPWLHGVWAAVGQDESAALSWAAGFAQASELASVAWARHGHKVSASSGSFGRLRGLAARAVHLHKHSGVTDQDGKPVLQVLSDWPSALTELQTVLQDLWSVVRKSRQTNGHEE